MTKDSTACKLEGVTFLHKKLPCKQTSHELDGIFFCTLWHDDTSTAIYFSYSIPFYTEISAYKNYINYKPQNLPDLKEEKNEFFTSWRYVLVFVKPVFMFPQRHSSIYAHQERVTSNTEKPRNLQQALRLNTKLTDWLN